MTKHKIINVFGMRRSGLHCILIDIKDNFTLYHKQPLLFVNDIPYGKRSVQPFSINLCEDQYPPFVRNNQELNISIIRDIYNNIVSRTHKSCDHHVWAEINKQYVNVLRILLQEALNIRKESVVINYDKYIHDTTYRAQLLKNTFSIKNATVFSNIVPSYGGGATFKKTESRKNVKIPLQTIKLFEDDPEIVCLISRYFNYNIIEKLYEHNNNIV